MVANETFDVFISYGHQDQVWVHALAENLRRAGLEVFLDAWQLTPGDVVVHQLERGLLASRNGVLVVSPASVTRPWVQQEYAVMVSRAIEGKQRLIPVLLGDVEVPPFAATRLWVDFRDADGPEYERQVGLLVAALLGKRSQPPPRIEDPAWPPASGLRPELLARPQTAHLDSKGEKGSTSSRSPLSDIGEERACTVLVLVPPSPSAWPLACW
jgi:hypothetical protein